MLVDGKDKYASMKNQKTTETYLQEVRVKHGDRYDYSKVSYKNNTTKIPIICSMHGEFLMRPKDHFNGQGCPECARVASYSHTAESYLEAIKTKWGDQYDYSRTHFESTRKKVEVICLEHGSFWVLPHWHLHRNQGCPRCRHTKRITPSDKFFSKAREVHGEKYRYDERVYRNSRGMIRAECPKHGWFEQRASLHLNGNGCSGCAKECRLLDTRTFISRAREVQKRQYDYSETIYKTAHDRVTIICPRHGRFTQKAYQHLAGQGCSSCADEANPGEYNPTLFKRYPELRGVSAKLYLVEFNLPDEKFLKVGITINDAAQRFRRYRRNLIVHKEIEMGLFKAYQLEQQLLQRHQNHAYTPRLKDFGGRTECFGLDRKPLLLDEFIHF